MSQPRFAYRSSELRVEVVFAEEASPQVQASWHLAEAQRRLSPLSYAAVSTGSAVPHVTVGGRLSPSCRTSTSSELWLCVADGPLQRLRGCMPRHTHHPSTLNTFTLNLLHYWHSWFNYRYEVSRQGRAAKLSLAAAAARPLPSSGQAASAGVFSWLRHVRYTCHIRKDLDLSD